MNEFISSMIIGVGTASLIAGVIAYSMLMPSPRTPRVQWLKRFLASVLIISLAGSIFLISLSLKDLPASDYSIVWRSVPSLLIAVVLVGSGLTAAIYAKLLLWEKRSELMNRLIQNMRAKKR